MITTAQAKKLYASTDGNDFIAMRDRALILIGFCTGMWRSSLIGIDLERISYPRNPGAPQVVTFDVKIKGDRRHRVPIHPAAWNLTRPYRDHLKRLGFHTGPLFRRTTEVQIVTNRRAVGDRLTEDGLYKALRKRLEGFKPNDFRRCLVSWAAAGGLSDVEVRAVTGTGTSRAAAVNRAQSVVDPVDVHAQSEVAEKVWKVVSTKLGIP